MPKAVSRNPNLVTNLTQKSKPGPRVGQWPCLTKKSQSEILEKSWEALLGSWESIERCWEERLLTLLKIFITRVRFFIRSGVLSKESGRRGGEMVILSWNPFLSSIMKMTVFFNFFVTGVGKDPGISFLDLRGCCFWGVCARAVFLALFWYLNWTLYTK